MRRFKINRSVYCGVTIAGVALVILLIAVATAPLQIVSKAEVFAIPKGTWARRMSGENLAILPEKIFLTVGVKDVLLLKNLDDVPQIFGPTLIMPGQSFQLPFEQAAEYQFACTAHASGQMTVVVDPDPIVGWPRLQWRVRNWWRTWLA